MQILPLQEAVALIPSGATLMIGGFMAVGAPERVIDELVAQGQTDLTIITNDTGKPNLGVGKLIDKKRAKRVVASHIGLNPETQRQMHQGALVVDLVPQGTLAECIRAGGSGLGGVLTQTGLGTLVEQGKQKVVVNGVEYLVEPAIRADFALIQAFLCDYKGNLTYALTGRNFNPIMAMAADKTIVAAEHIVPIGMIAPDHVVTPGPLVDYVIARG